LVNRPQTQIERIFKKEAAAKNKYEEEEEEAPDKNGHLKLPGEVEMMSPLSVHHGITLKVGKSIFMLLCRTDNNKHFGDVCTNCPRRNVKVPYA
jgi:hypothetical protein